MKKNMFLILLTIVLLFVINNKVYASTLENVYEIRPTVNCVIGRDKSNNIMAMQGVYFFDHYAVYAGFESDTKPTVITLVDLNTCTILDKNNEKIMGHDNDITYNSNENKFYVISSLSDKKVYGFKIVNDKIVHDTSVIQANFRIGGLAYDKENNRYFSQASNGKFYTFNSFYATGDDYKEIANFDGSYDFDGVSTRLVKQGMSYSNNNIYFARTISDSSSLHYNDSYVLVFNAMTGEYKYAMHFPSTYFNGHLEGITVVGNKIYFGINVHTEPQNQSFLVYDGIDEIEKEYNRNVKQIELVKIDNDISIFENEDFNYSKIKMQLTYNDDSKELIDLNKNNCKLLNFDNQKIGNQNITIEYDGKKYKLDINIKKIEEDSRELILKNPIEIFKGNSIDYSNIYILIKYNNGTQKEIKLDKNNTEVLYFDNQKIGNQKIKIKYDNKEYECNILVKENIVINITSPKIGDSIGNTKPNIVLKNNDSFELYNSSFLEDYPSDFNINFSNKSNNLFEENKIYYIGFSLKAANTNIKLKKDDIILNLDENNINYELNEEQINNDLYYIFLMSFEPTYKINDNDYKFVESKDGESAENPTTSDNIYMYICLFVLLVIGSGLTFEKIIRKNN